MKLLMTSDVFFRRKITSIIKNKWVISIMAVIDEKSNKNKLTSTPEDNKKVRCYFESSVNVFLPKEFLTAN